MTPQVEAYATHRVVGADVVGPGTQRTTWVLRTDEPRGEEPSGPLYFVGWSSGRSSPLVSLELPLARRYRSIEAARAWRDLELGGRAGRWRVVRVTRRPAR